MAGAALCFCACGGSGSTSEEPVVPTPTPEPEPAPIESTFAEGADISWVTELEAEGHQFYNKAGEKRECTALMKELGLNAIRLRVWVNPTKWCDKADVVVKAKRAAALGMDVMIDFHYSDDWADPSKQYKPAAWKGLALADLKKALANHTKEVLQALKAEGVTPKWVQVGNEIRPGMLWDEDKALSGASWDVTENNVVKYPMNWGNLGAFVTTGYNAVKEVFPNAIVIVHLDNGYDEGLYTWFFDELKKNGGKWDMIGMSIYPYWTMQSNSTYTPEKTITDCIANVKKVSSRYNCDVMIVETGMECGDDKGNLASTTVLNSGKQQLALLLKQCKENTNGRCKGVFYWEPECRPGPYRLGAFTADGRPTVIMDAFAEN
ncbi:MAG: glycosyl hydrolase 53 family protein [Bacteroides sp.]|nr:glycosyl hydrolase 53 family protein [Bacteroides sp.]